MSKKYINTIVIGDIAVGTEVTEESIGSRWNSFVADGYIVEAPEKVVNVASADCSELQAEIDDLKEKFETAKTEAQAEVDRLNGELETAKQNIAVPGDFDNLLADLAKANTKADYEAIKEKYKGGDTDEN